MLGEGCRPALGVRARELGWRGASSTAAVGRQGKLDSDSSHVGATIGVVGRRGRRRTLLGGSASFMRRQPRRGERSLTAAARAGGGIGEIGTKGVGACSTVAAGQLGELELGGTCSTALRGDRSRLRLALADGARSSFPSLLLLPVLAHPSLVVTVFQDFSSTGQPPSTRRPGRWEAVQDAEAGAANSTAGGGGGERPRACG